MLRLLTQASFSDPSVDAAIASIPRTRHDVVVLSRLHADHLGSELGVVAEVGVYEFTAGELDQRQRMISVHCYTERSRFWIYVRP
jgi:hypothetical protein